jgi:hypothetical protein
MFAAPAKPLKQPLPSRLGQASSNRVRGTHATNDLAEAVAGSFLDDRAGFHQIPATESAEAQHGGPTKLKLA